MKALIAMSGGVDSSVAAKLMLDQGYECVGCTMKLYNNPDAGCSSKTCCSIRDVEDARSVAVRLGMPYLSLTTWTNSVGMSWKPSPVPTPSGKHQIPALTATSS